MSVIDMTQRGKEICAAAVSDLVHEADLDLDAAQEAALGVAMTTVFIDAVRFAAVEVAARFIEQGSAHAAQVEAELEQLTPPNLSPSERRFIDGSKAALCEALRASLSSVDLGFAIEEP